MSQPKEERIKVGPLEMRFKVDGSHTSGHVAVAEMIVPAGARVPPPHFHVDVDETVQVLEGTLTYRVDDEVRELHAGEHMFSPRGSVHAFSNPGTVDARALVVFSPAKIGPEYFREVGEVLAVPGPPDVAKLKSVMTKHGLVLAP
jgi:quercetin dioxygenase-like cupin family protein